MIGYARYLVTSKLFDRILIHFLVTGHTKFSPDRMFGWMSMLLRKNDIFSPIDVLECINKEKSKSYKAILCTRSMIKNWTPYITNNYNRIERITKWHLVMIEKSKQEVVTKAKVHRSDKTWLIIQHM